MVMHHHQHQFNSHVISMHHQSEELLVVVWELLLIDNRIGPTSTAMLL
jgi:hypothetical protein